MESTGRTRSAEHVTGTGMAQLAIDRHAASATRQAVTAPALRLEGIMGITWTVEGLGAKYAGQCVSCHRRIDGYHLADALLLSRDVDGKRAYGVTHASCCGVATKGAVGGGRKPRGPLPETVTEAGR